MASHSSLFNKKWHSRRSNVNSHDVVVHQSLTAMVMEIRIKQQPQAVERYFSEGLAHQIIVL